MTWEGRRVLVTGHTGFKGAWLSLWLQHRGAEVTGIALDPEDGAGAFAAMAPWPGLVDQRCDVRDRNELRRLVVEARPDVVFHLAAQALVRRSYADPVGTFESNVVGTANLLDAVGHVDPAPVVVVVTSDKVYRPGERPHREDDPLGGNDPYSASKAGQELVVGSWRSSLAGALVTARAGNVVGGGDRAPDRLVPDLVRAVESSTSVHLRYPAATRPWQFVLDPLAGYLAYAEALLAGATPPPALNFGPPAEAPATVGEVVEQMRVVLGGPAVELDDGEHLHEAPFLSLDATLAQRELSWAPRLGLEQALEWTGRWYRAQWAGEDMRAVSLAQLDDYERLGAS